MTKKNDPALLTAICELVANTGTPPKKAAQQLGVSSSSYHSWITQCGKNPTEWLTSFCGEELPFIQALGLARRLYLHDALADFEQFCAQGEETPLVYKGQISWKEREDLVGIDDATLEQLGYRDRWERDADGRRIPLTIKTRAPTQAVIKMLEANFRQYSPRSEVVQRTVHSGGVTVVGAKPPAPITVIAPVAIAPPTEITDAEIEPETDFLDEEPTPKLPEPEQPLSSTEERKIIEPEPVVEAPPTKPLTALQRDLLARLKQRPANPQPRDVVKIFRPDASEDRAEANNIGKTR
jgi:hypothetical protein